VSVPGGNGEWPMTVPWNDPGVAFAGGVVTGLLSFVAPETRPVSGEATGPVPPGPVSPPHAIAIPATVNAHATAKCLTVQVM
jgi:hypothetical protein